MKRIINKQMASVILSSTPFEGDQRGGLNLISLNKVEGMADTEKTPGNSGIIGLKTGLAGGLALLLLGGFSG